METQIKHSGMAEPPRKKLKGNTILDYFGKKSGCDSVTAGQVESLGAASPTDSGERPNDNSGATALVDILLPVTSEEGEPDSDSHSEPSLEPVSEPEREVQEGGATLAVSTTLTDTELSQLPVCGPYDFGVLKASLLRGRLTL